MADTHSIMKLHLRYRLWIAEMNYDVTVLRIFDDYLNELATKKSSPVHSKALTDFEEQFINIRKQIDELKHEMHLQKMKLAATARGGKLMDKNIYDSENHEDFKKQYTAFRELFDKMKIDFINFEKF